MSYISLIGCSQCTNAYCFSTFISFIHGIIVLTAIQLFHRICNIFLLGIGQYFAITLELNALLFCNLIS